MAAEESTDEESLPDIQVGVFPWSPHFVNAQLLMDSRPCRTGHRQSCVVAANRKSTKKRQNGAIINSTRTSMAIAV